MLTNSCPVRHQGYSKYGLILDYQYLTVAQNGISDTLLAKYTNDGSGNWKDNQLATSFGKFYKQTKGHTTKLTLSPIGKQIVWDINDTTKNLGTFLSAFNTNCCLYFIIDRY